MHADFQELLSLRDGEPVAAEVEQHVSDCLSCGLEFARLQRLKQELRQLPEFEAPKGGWESIRGQLDRPSHRFTGGNRLYRSAAVVAGALVALAALWSVQFGRPHFSAARSAVVADPIAPLVSRSQQLEAMLEQLPQRPSVQRAATSATIDELQTRIQLLDLQLANTTKDHHDAVETQRLWSARVQLLDSLVYVRYAEAARDGHQPNALDTGVI